MCNLANARGRGHKFAKGISHCHSPMCIRSGEKIAKFIVRGKIIRNTSARSKTEGQVGLKPNTLEIINTPCFTRAAMKVPNKSGDESSQTTPPKGAKPNKEMTKNCSPQTTPSQQNKILTTQCPKTWAQMFCKTRFGRSPDHNAMQSHIPNTTVETHTAVIQPKVFYAENRPKEQNQTRK